MIAVQTVYVVLRMGENQRSLGTLAGIRDGAKGASRALILSARRADDKKNRRTRRPGVCMTTLPLLYARFDARASRPLAAIAPVAAPSATFKPVGGALHRARLRDMLDLLRGRKMAKHGSLIIIALISILLSSCHENLHFSQAKTLFRTSSPSTTIPTNIGCICGPSTP